LNAIARARIDINILDASEEQELQTDPILIPHFLGSVRCSIDSHSLAVTLKDFKEALKEH
jgi:hypothetical protein